MALSRANERLLRRISTRKGREAEGVVLLEGSRAIEAALEHGADIVFAGRDPRGSAANEGIVSQLVGRGVDVAEVPHQDLRELVDTESPQGVFAVAREPRVSLGAATSSRRVLVLDALQDPGNVGTLVRTAAGFGVEQVLALDGTADPWSGKAVRASAGLVFKVRPVVVPWEVAREWLGGTELPLLVADAKGEDVRSWLARYRGRRGGFALVLGNEAAGPRPEVLRSAAASLAVPLIARAESLNVAVAGAVLLWALGPGAETTVPEVL